MGISGLHACLITFFDFLVMPGHLLNVRNKTGRYYVEKLLLSLADVKVDFQLQVA